ncbi:MAG: photosynthetic reaction center subunit H [Pseudomonadota bacterium]
MYGTIIGTVDLAQVALYLFWLFFAGLVIYLQRENMREGYPLEDEAGGVTKNQGPFPLPDPKTFRLPHGRGEVTVPNGVGDTRHIALEPMSPSAGSPFVPTGDPLADGVGPAAWAERRDVPELDGHGHAKIKPMTALEEFSVVAGRDARGLPVVSHDQKMVGKVTDMWIDVPEQLVRYLEFDMGDAGHRLVPIQLVKIKSDHVAIHSLYAEHFAGVPSIASKDQITLLEEEKVCAYYCGGKLYAHESRLEAVL